MHIHVCESIEPKEKFYKILLIVSSYKTPINFLFHCIIVLLMVSKKYLAICTSPSFMRAWRAPAKENVLQGGRIIANILVLTVYFTTPWCPSNLYIVCMTQPRSQSLSGESEMSLFCLVYFHLGMESQMRGTPGEFQKLSWIEGIGQV